MDIFEGFTRDWLSFVMINVNKLPHDYAGEAVNLRSDILCTPV